ncbi:MAG: glycosyltransferase family 39 protein [Legionellaceae bacterium]|nr:glycosyltransferase family 39 protein [Legionellaceae bacterium]
MPNIALSYPEQQKNVTAAINRQTHDYFWLFIILHTLFWTIGPALLRPSLPHDTLEGISWGLQWQWGYSKHPFLTAWLCALASQLGGGPGWPVYLLAQLAISLTFWAVWQLARQMLAAVPALVAALLLEGILFYNINSFNLTPDSLQSPVWALLSLFFYKALRWQKKSDWLLSGALAALAVCTKYQAVLMLLPLFAFSLVNPLARSRYRQPGIWLALSLFAVLLIPHGYWLYHHDLITVRYASSTPAEYTPHPGIWAHLRYPLDLIAKSLGYTAPLLLLIWPFYRSCSGKSPFNEFDRQFLGFVGLGPWILTLGLCLLSGGHFPARWLTPYFFLSGLLLFHFISVPLTRRQLMQFALSLLLLSTVLFSARMLSFSVYGRPESDAFLPNQAIAARLQQLWEEKYHSPLPYLAGSHYLVALVTPYFQQPVQPFFSWNKQDSPWIDERELRRQGAIFIWDRKQQYVWDASSRQYSQLPAAVLADYPALQRLPDLHVPRARGVGQAVTIGVAILPPQQP